MNPEAVAWLEGLDLDRHSELFRGPLAAGLFTVKHDHESGSLVHGCPRCNFGVGLIVVGD